MHHQVRWQYFTSELQSQVLTLDVELELCHLQDLRHARDGHDCELAAAVRARSLATLRRPHGPVYQGEPVLRALESLMRRPIGLGSMGHRACQDVGQACQRRCRPQEAAPDADAEEEHVALVVASQGLLISQWLTVSVASHDLQALGDPVELANTIPKCADRGTALDSDLPRILLHTWKDARKQARLRRTVDGEHYLLPEHLLGSFPMAWAAEVVATGLATMPCGARFQR
mmetsp:Transcript_75458/g.161675  ORF Transcript_75458/g.161675 Transcript_75458/m.161675 type:complete len:230 (+) Transcript_75458:184-873(+)